VFILKHLNIKFNEQLVYAIKGLSYIYTQVNNSQKFVVVLILVKKTRIFVLLSSLRVFFRVAGSLLMTYEECVG